MSWLQAGHETRTHSQLSAAQSPHNLQVSINPQPVEAKPQPPSPNRRVKCDVVGASDAKAADASALLDWEEAGRIESGGLLREFGFQPGFCVGILLCRVPWSQLGSTTWDKQGLPADRTDAEPSKLSAVDYADFKSFA